MPIRYSKIVLVFSVALFFSLLVFNNVVDYRANYPYVIHVLQMDDIFPGNSQAWRAIESPFLHNMAYGLITLAELLVAVLCWVGGFRLYRAVGDAGGFNRAKCMAVMGLTLSFVLWFVGFTTIAGEWFLMWQSQDWNAQQVSFRLAMTSGVVLLYLALPDGD